MLRHLVRPSVSRGVLIGLLLALATGAVAQAQDDDDAAQSISGRVQNRLVEDGERITDPVPGVRIVLEDEAGSVVGEAETAEDGTYRVGVDEPGAYVIRIDPESLPEGLTAEDGRDEQQVVVGGNQRVTRVFFLGEDTRDVKGKFDRLPQALANGFKLAMIIAITSVGLSLVFGTTGLSNFAHGEMVTFGALIAWFLNAEVGMHIIPATALAMVAGALIGLGQERGVWRPLRKRKTSLTSMMIVSIGVGLAVRYLYLYTFGGRSRAYRQYAVQSAIDVGPVSLTKRDLVSMAVCVIVLIGVALFLQRSRQGKAIRAVSDNPELASATGINTNRVILLVWVAGGALAGLGGILLGLDEQVRWNMGFTLLLLMFAAITVGGLGNPYGALAGSLLIGLTVELWTWIFPGAVELKTTGALITLIVVLLVRPQGLLGRKERVG
jgi:branched-subunit amino acid ABC-type transport system permease component